MPEVAAFDANTADTDGLVRWLETALDGYIKDDMGRWAFRPLEQHIGGGDDLADDLCAIYDSLTASAQARWRSAVRDVLAVRGRDTTKREATRVLIDFAVLTRSTEVLDVLPGILSGSDDSELLHMAVRAATDMASHTEASRKCLERIRTSPAFTPDYAGLVLVALCHADPDNWLRHVRELAEPMHRLANLLPHESTALRFYASNVLEAISLSRITSASLNAASEGGLSWLQREWLEGKDSLLHMRQTATGRRLMLRADEAVSVELERTDTTLVPSSARPNRTAIAWEREGSDRMWVAIYTQERLAELECVEPSPEALDALMGGCLGQEVAVDWPTQMPAQGGLVPLATGGAQKINSHELLTLWNPAAASQLTERVGHLGQYREQIDHSLRRLAFNNPPAFDATAWVLKLAAAPSSRAAA